MKFRLKMTLCMLWLLALVFGAGGGALITLSLRAALQQSEAASLENYSANLRALQLVTATSIQKNYDTLCTALRSLEEEQNWACVRLHAGDTIILQDGRTDVLASLTPEPEHCATQIQHEAWQGQAEVYLQISGRFSTSDETLQLDVAYLITDVYDTQRRMLRIYTYVFLAVIALGGALSWGVSYVLTKPLGKLSAAARRLAAGQLSCRVRPRTGDEVGQLCRDFNAMAAQLKANITELQQAMERQERFMGSFAHELKTPMTSIIGYADLLRSQALPPQEAMDAANYIFSEGKRLESLSLKLLELLVLKNQTPELVSTEPAKLIAALCRHLRPIYEKENIQLRYSVKPGLCRLEPDLVQSLLVNLLDNARKALEHGGNIYLAADWQEDFLRIRILDNGRGMPPEALARLTEAFYRVDKSRARAQGGAGLGLALCQKIAALHGGSIAFASREGGGTCVTVLLKGARS